MSMPNKDLTRKIQLRQFSILCEIDRICKRNEINYYLIGGSALGAVRHSGFIPWDDDIDIALLRHDYDRLLECCKKELSNTFFLQTSETDKHYFLGFSKVRINGTLFEESFYVDSKMHQGIFLDIFPLDNITDNKIGAYLRFYLVKLLTKIILLKYNRIDTVNSMLVQILFFPVVKFVPNRMLLNLVDKNVQLGKSTNSTNVINYFTVYKLKKELFPLSIWGTPRLANFEGREFPVPEHTDAYLTQLFGDYMKLPPEKDRIGHQIINVEFGDDK